MLAVNIFLEVTNTLSLDFFTFPSTDIVLLLHLEIDDNWHRMINPVQPTLVLGRQLERDSYGIRVRTINKPSKVSIWDLQKTVRSLFDTVIFFQVMKALIQAFALFALGKASAKWRDTVRQNVNETNVMVLGLRKTTESRLRASKNANELLQQVSKAALVAVDPTGALHGKRDEQVTAIIDMLDVNGDGKVGILEFEDLLRLTKVEFDQDTAQHLMWLLSPNSNGVLTRKEIARLILAGTTPVMKSGSTDAVKVKQKFEIIF